FEKGGSGFAQAWHQPREIAWLRACIQLRCDQFFPRRAAGRGRARQAEHKRVVGQTGERARLQRRCADLLETDRAEQFAETRHFLVEQRSDGFRRGIAPGKTGATGDQHAVHGVLITGGTGFTGRDSTPEAIAPLLDKEMPGFGELFRAISFEEIGTSSLQSRAFAGLANNTFVFCLPGSTSACRTAWEKLIAAQLDARTKPCNLAGLMPRLRET